MLPENYHAMEHAKGIPLNSSTAWWVKFNIFFTAPVLAIVAFLTVPIELAHLKHLEEHPQRITPYHYVRKRKTEMPWGPDSLFHHPLVNTVADE
ncbi:hypothetical protein HK098_007711 [Nowakowskiella sp. JEL0407]|nr:hypothetical protein HK098_007711 [Nowakowskiella sp. JEL0407]